MSNTTCRRAVPPRGLKSRRISPSPPPPQTPAAFCAAWRFGEGAMGVGLYSVSCGFGCGCGFGGLTSLIAMVLALRARGASHGDGREGVFGNPPFNGSLVGAPGQWGFARTGLPFGPNLVSAHAHRMPLRHFGRPVQHHRHPSRSSAWFKGGETPPCELRALLIARWDVWDEYVLRQVKSQRYF